MKNLKKYIVGVAMGMAVAGTLVSCDALDNKFNNPDQLTEPNFSLLFASVQTQGHLFRYEYGATYHYMRGYGKMLGLGVSPLYLDRSQNNAIVQPWSGWSGTPFNEYIFMQTNTAYSKEISGMKLLYNGMSDEEKETNKVYMLCADIIKSYAFQRSTDLYDDIPYSEAGGGYQEKFYAKYDTQEEIYHSILETLKNAVDGLSSYRFASDGAKATFSSVDMLCNGDIQQWIRFANSLRLRMALRLCQVEPETSKSVIKEVLADGRYLSEYSHDIGFEEQDKTHAFELTFFRGIDERGYECGAPATIVKNIFNYEYQEGDPTDLSKLDATRRNKIDPRILAMFQPDIHGRYIGLPLTMEEAEAPQGDIHKYYTEKEINDMFNFNDAESGPWDEKRIPSMYNRRTYFNFDMKFPVMGSTETNLILVEAKLRWPELTGIDEKSCLRKAIDASTRFFYNANATMSYNESSLPSIQHIKANAKAPQLNEEWLAAYEENAVSKYEALSSTKDKLKFIFDQKFAHMNIMNPYELYSDARRLVKDFNGELPFVAIPNVVFQERMFYPSSELADNPDNFAAVASKNTYDHPVWWTGRTSAAKNRNGNALQ